MHTLSPLDIFALQTVVLAGVLYLFGAWLLHYDSKKLSVWDPLAAILAAIFFVGTIMECLVWVVHSRTDAVACVGLCVLGLAAAAGIHGTVKRLCRRKTFIGANGLRYADARSGPDVGLQNNGKALGGSKSDSGVLSHPEEAKRST